MSDYSSSSSASENSNSQDPMKKKVRHTIRDKVLSKMTKIHSSFSENVEFKRQ